MPRTRTVVALTCLVAVAGAALTAPVLWLELDEAAVPPASALHGLPDDATVTGEDQGCGSGGCWLELTVDAPDGTSGTELAGAVAPGAEVCGVRSVVDLRRVCTWVLDADASTTTFGVSYRRFLDS